MKKLLLSTLIATLVVVGAAPAGTASAAPYCGITWGSLEKTAVDTSMSQLTNVRAGQHDCYDRMVFDMNGPASGYIVKYVSNVYTDGAGMLVPLAGGAKLQITLNAHNYNPETGAITYAAVTGQKLPGINLSGYQTFREAKFAGSFEGNSTIGLGVRAKLPFRVFKLDNRVVLDVAHYW